MQSSLAEIVNYGQIGSMPMPAGWVESERRENVTGNSSLRKFCPVDDERAGLYFYYRGYGLGPSAAGTFAGILHAGPHHLDSAEVLCLGTVIREKANAQDYTVFTALVTSLSGRDVLVVEGGDNRFDESAFSIYIDADGSGRFVQEISFQAPTLQYHQYVQCFKDCLQKLVWA